MLIDVYQNNNKLISKEIGGKSIELIKISDSTYVNRENERFIQFKSNPETKTMDMLVIDPNDGTIFETFPRMDNDEKIPIEFLVEGGFNQSLEAFQELM